MYNIASLILISGVRSPAMLMIASSKLPMLWRPAYPNCLYCHLSVGVIMLISETEYGDWQTNGKKMESWRSCVPSLFYKINTLKTGFKKLFCADSVAKCNWRICDSYPSDIISSTYMWFLHFYSIMSVFELHLLNHKLQPNLTECQNSQITWNIK
jgi:hypothetical protein